MNRNPDMNDILQGTFGKNRPPLFEMPQRAPKEPEKEMHYIQDLDAGVSAQKVFDPNFGKIATPPTQYDDEGTAPAMSTQGPWGQPPPQK